MKMRRVLLSGAALLTVALGMPAAAQQQQQQQPPPPPPSPQQQQQPPREDPLVAASKKAKADKAKTAPRKVYTEEELSKLKSDGVSVVGEERFESAEATTKSEPGKAQGAPVKDEAYWRGRASKIREQMEEMDRRIEKLKEEIRTGGSAGFSATTSQKESVIYIHDRNAQIKQLEDRKAALQKQLDDLMEEGRKAGANPGWFR
jgi:glucose/arabinose dehydrogenase